MFIHWVTLYPLLVEQQNRQFVLRAIISVAHLLQVKYLKTKTPKLKNY